MLQSDISIKVVISPPSDISWSASIKFLERSSCDASNNCLNFSGFSISGVIPPKRLFDRYNELPPKRNSPSLIHTCNKVESFVESSGVTDFLKSETLEKEDIFNKVKKLSKHFQDGLHSLKDLECVDSIRNYGLLGGIDISMRDKPGKAGFNVYKKCYDAGVNIKPTGDALIIAPPFICERKHIDEIIEKIRTGIKNHIS